MEDNDILENQDTTCNPVVDETEDEIKPSEHSDFILWSLIISAFAAVLAFFGTLYFGIKSKILKKELDKERENTVLLEKKVSEHQVRIEEIEQENAQLQYAERLQRELDSKTKE